MDPTGVVAKPLALVVMLALLGAWILRTRRDALLKPPAVASSFLLVLAGWVGLHEVPPLGWALVVTGFLLPWAARRRRPPRPG